MIMTEPRFSDERTIEEEHCAISAIMHWIEADLDRQDSSAEELPTGGPLVGPLRSFREHLRRHFAFEEQNGVIPAAIALRTDVSIEDWKGQHARILERLDEVILAFEEANREGEAPPHEYGRLLRAIFAELREHEALENRLLGTGRIDEFRSRQHGFEEAGPL